MTPIKDLGAVGLVADQPGYELPPNAFTSVRNVRMYRGHAERIGGHSQVFSDTAVVPYWLHAHATSTKRYIVHAGLAAVYVDDGTTRTEITGTAPTGAASDTWTGGSFNGLLVVNNGKDKPMYWDNNTANNLATLTGWDANHTCRALRPYKYFLIALAPTKSAVAYPHTVMWSDSAEAGAIPTEWASTDTNDAGESPALAETPDVIVDGLPLGDTFVIYKERSMYGMQLIGGNDIFRFWRLPGESGILARNCVASTPNGHVVLTQGDVILHNGQGVKSIIDQRIRRRLFSTIDSSNYAQSFVVANQQKEEVWICYPTIGNSACTRAVIWNWTDNTLTERDLPNVTHGCLGVVDASPTSSVTWSGVSGTWASIVGAWSSFGTYSKSESRVFLGTTASKIFVVDEGDAAAGAAFEATVERTGLHFDSPDTVKMCRGIWPKINGSTGTTVTIQVGASMDPETSPTWSDAQTFTVGTSTKIDTFATGRYLSYRVTSTGTTAWRLRSMDMDIVTQGRF